MKKSSLVPVTSLLVLSITFSACNTPGQGAKNGAIIGGAIGALQTGRLSGAVAGAAIGAAAGAVIGKVHEDERRAYYRDGGYYYQDNTPVHYPVARPTNRPGFVTSPYPPHALIDVRGIPSGATVADPASNGLFINPW